MTECGEWLHARLQPGWTVYAKRLSANDTGATEAHQAGPYMPRGLVDQLLPGFFHDKTPNPRREFPAAFDQPAAPEATVNIIWYNSRVLGTGTRNESRATGWGGRQSPLLDPNQTGALAIFAFERGRDAPRGCRVWICASVEEEEEVQSRLGEVDPARPVVVHDGVRDETDTSSRCRLKPDALPKGWDTRFPEASELVDYAIDECGASNHVPADQRLLLRRDCEYRLFRSLEDILVMPMIRGGFDSIESFVDLAATVSNRRKARAGRSLELHLRRIFDEARVPYAHGAITEGAKKPDFLFPSAAAYHDLGFPSSRLRVLAAKTTCKDRWRQVINEADRLRGEWKHLLTLQEGVSKAQFAEMRAERVKLVVPQKLWAAFPKSVRSELVSVEAFLAEIRGTVADARATV